MSPIIRITTEFQSLLQETAVQSVDKFI